MAEKGLPTVFTPGLLTGANGPVTIAGGLVQGNAEMLAGFVLAELIREGTPLVYGGGVLPIDMRTTLMSYASPEFMMAACALKDMARHYRLPMFHFAGCTDSKVFDQQAALEGGIGMMLGALSGGNLENARILEQITALLITLNIKHGVHGAGVRITGLPVREPE